MTRNKITDMAEATTRPDKVVGLHFFYPASVVRVVEKELLTPLGLRTLARGEAGYVPRFRGGPWERDTAYHQGTVWPWLIGPYVRGSLAAFGRNPSNVAACRRLLEPLEAHLSSDACLGQVSEVFDAEEPYRPGGCPAQAWSVAELLRLMTVDLVEPAVREKRPPRAEEREERR